LPLHAVFAGDNNQRLAVAIWTTTPWTLPANLAVAVNSDLDYALVSPPPSPLLLSPALLFIPYFSLPYTRLSSLTTTTIIIIIIIIITTFLLILLLLIITIIMITVR
jgi:hypothetical protein